MVLSYPRDDDLNKLKLNLHYLRMLTQKIFWTIAFWEKDLWKISMIQNYFPFIWTNLYPLYPKLLCAKFGWNWPCGSKEEDEHVKSLRQRHRPHGQIENEQILIRKNYGLRWAKKVNKNRFNKKKGGQAYVFTHKIRTIL